MTNFAAAQERILARRAAREAAESSRAALLTHSRTERLLSLPPTLRVLAQQTLNAWDVVRSPHGTRPTFRVGQVDAELLDEELINLLKNQAGEGLKLFGAHLKDEWGAEINGVLRAVIMEAEHMGSRSELRSKFARIEVQRREKTEHHNNTSRGDGVAESSVRAAHSRRTIRMDEMGRPAFSAGERLRRTVTSHTTIQPTNDLPEHNTQHCRIHIFSHLPLQRKVPNLDRSIVTYAACTVIKPDEQRSLFRISQPAACLACLH